MHRIILFALISLWLLSSCNPTTRTYPRRLQTGLDSTEYAGYVEGAQQVDLRKARFLAKFKVGDTGVSYDCAYPDVLRLAEGLARPMGGNLVVVTQHTQFEVKSKCHKIKGDIYALPSLEGVESQISWHAKRPLMPGDLRGARPTNSAAFPPLHCTLDCRVGGDYFKEAILRTRTTFWADSTYLPADTAFALRRAQLHFDLTELHARKLKSELVAMGADLPAISGQFRGMLAKHQTELRQQTAALDGELAGADRAAVLTRWEGNVHGELAALAAYWGDDVVDLRKKKRH